jgi:hypothetical protein
MKSRVPSWLPDIEGISMRSGVVYKAGMVEGEASDS